MSANSTAFYSVQYASAVELLAQQMAPRLAMLARQMTGEGKSATVVNQVDAIEADERTTRYDDIVPGDPTHTRPWVYPRHFDKAVFFDTLDQVRMNANPQSEYVQALVAAINRKMDDEVVRAFFANRNLGENAETSEAFAAAMQVGVSVGGTTSGLTVEKLQAALEIFRGLEVGLDQPEQINCAISPKQERNLMNEIEVTSSDFTVKKILDSGTMAGSGYEPPAGRRVQLPPRDVLDGQGHGLLHLGRWPQDRRLPAQGQARHAVAGLHRGPLRCRPCRRRPRRRDQVQRGLIANI